MRANINVALFIFRSHLCFDVCAWCILLCFVCCITNAPLFGCVPCPYRIDNVINANCSSRPIYMRNITRNTTNTDLNVSVCNNVKCENFSQMYTENQQAYEKYKRCRFQYCVPVCGEVYSLRLPLFGLHTAHAAKRQCVCINTSLIRFD